jgi:hypothetical protein
MSISSRHYKEYFWGLWFNILTLKQFHEAPFVIRPAGINHAKRL